MHDGGDIGPEAGPGQQGAGPARRAVPATARGRRSRKALLDAARVIFARDGFNAARITDIADQAGTAHGSFYTYFTSKEEVFLALIEELEDDLRVSGDDREPVSDPYERILRANREYLSAYWANREIMIVWEQVATLNPDVAELRNAASDRATTRIEHSVKALQADGLVDTALDARYVAFALSGMVSSFAYRWCVRHVSFTVEEATDQLSRLWANALGIPTP